MKKILLFMMVLLLMGCEKSVEVLPSEAVIKNVKVMTVNNDVYTDYEIYYGFVVGSGMVKQSFEVDGKIDEILVSVGDTIHTGDVLARLNQEALQYALDAAKSEERAAASQYSKALEGLDYTKNLYTKTQTLFEDQVASQMELDQAELNYNLAKSDVNSAYAIHNQSLTNVEAKTYLLNHSTLIASKDGVVVEILGEVGELIGAGYPVVISRDTEPVITFGITQSDLKYIEIGMSVDVILDGERGNGLIKEIKQSPDLQTQTYQVEISAGERSATLGQLAEVQFETEDYYGSKIPLGAIRSDGDDYVFVVLDQRGVKANIDVLTILNQYVIVDGLEDNSVVIVEGIMDLTSGDQVKVVDN